MNFMVQQITAVVQFVDPSGRRLYVTFETIPTAM
jgi:hypothetical protein